mgnify:FL=1
MKKETIIKGKKISILCLGIFIVSAIINMVVGVINILGNVGTSFPWYTPIVFTLIYYSVPLVLIFLIYIFFKMKEKKIKE